MIPLGYNDDMLHHFLKYDRIITFTHSSLPEAKALEQRIIAYLLDRGIKTVDPIEIDKDGALFSEANLADCDLMIMIGGDGGMLRASHAAGEYGLPILGINQGRLGFLTELSDDDWESGVDKFLAGQHRIEHRMMLHGEHWRDDKKLNEWDVLNDLVVVRGRFVRPITLGISVGGCPLISYVADGVIISTATGSTAYSLAVGGPILLPEMRNIIIIPISPHFSVDRAFVVSAEDEITIRLDTNHEAVISPDGKTSVMIRNGDLLKVRASKWSASFVRFTSPGDFYSNLTRYLEKNPIAQKINQS